MLRKIRQQNSSSLISNASKNHRNFLKDTQNILFAAEKCTEGGPSLSGHELVAQLRLV
jgi:hypothetical protein